MKYSDYVGCENRKEELGRKMQELNLVLDILLLLLCRNQVTYFGRQERTTGM